MKLRLSAAVLGGTLLLACGAAHDGSPRGSGEDSSSSGTSAEDETSSSEADGGMSSTGESTGSGAGAAAGDPEAGTSKRREKDLTKLESYCRIEIDQGGDDSLDYIVAIERDEAGRELELHYDDLNGTNDRQLRYEYDQAGKRTLSESSVNGNVKEREVWTYEEGLLVLRVKYVEGGDTVADQTAYTYDEQGRQLCETHSFGNEATSSCRSYEGERVVSIVSGLKEDGSSSSTITYTYEEGVLVSTTVEYEDESVSDRVTTYDLTSDGSARETRVNNPGQANESSSIVVTTRNEFGEEVRLERDSDGDGTFESVDIFEYDDFGNLTYGATEAGGELTVWTDASFNEDGHPLHRKSGSDGHGDFEKTEDYDYDDDGFLTKMKQSTGITLIETYHYDCEGP